MAEKTPEEIAADKAAAEKEAAEAKAAADKAEADKKKAEQEAEGEDKLSPEVKAILAKNRKAAADAEKARKAAEAKVKEYEDRDKTEHQKAIERAEAAEKRTAELERQGWQRDAASKAKLPAGMASRLSGATAEEIEADATALAESLKGLNPGPGDAGQGTRQEIAGKDVESMSTDDFAKEFSRHK